MSAISVSTLLPGDVVNTKDLGLKKKKLLIGPGLVSVDEETVCACKAGALKHKPDGSNMIWIDSRQKRVSVIDMIR